MNNNQTIGHIVNSHVSSVNNYGSCNEKDSFSPKNFKVHRTILYILCIVSLILSSIALSQVFPYNSHIDYIGLILGVFSFITALLMWWNIYAVIDMKSIKEELSKREISINRHIEIGINEGLIQEETTCLRIFYKELGWIKILPIMTNITFRSIKTCKTYEEYNDIEPFVETVGQMIHEIKNEEINSSELNGFMALFKGLEPYNSRVVLIFQEYEKRKRGNATEVEYMSIRN